MPKEAASYKVIQYIKIDELEVKCDSIQESKYSGKYIFSVQVGHIRFQNWEEIQLLFL